MAAPKPSPITTDARLRSLSVPLVHAGSSASASVARKTTMVWFMYDPLMISRYGHRADINAANRASSLP
jgi:hypothetical protein